MKKDINLSTDLITPNVAMSLIPAFSASYGMAAFVADTVDFLGWELREQILPHLKNWAVEYELQRRAKEGIIPFTCSLVPNSRKNHRHIELRKNGFVITVSQTHSINAMPRDCVFRNDYCMDGQIALSGFGSGEPDASKEVYAILTHGCGATVPSFILCGIPASNMSLWAQHVNLFEVVKNMTIIDTSPVDDDIKLDYREKVKVRVKEYQ